MNFKLYDFTVKNIILREKICSHKLLKIIEIYKLYKKFIDIDLTNIKFNMINLNQILQFYKDNNKNFDFNKIYVLYYYGNQKLRNNKYSRDFWIFGLMIEKIFERDWSLFLNFENFSDTRQSRYESIFSGTLANPIFGDIYAPLDGFIINGGVKLRF